MDVKLLTIHSSNHTIKYCRKFSNNRVFGEQGVNVFADMVLIGGDLEAVDDSALVLTGECG